MQTITSRVWSKCGTQTFTPYLRFFFVCFFDSQFNINILIKSSLADLSLPRPEGSTLCNIGSHFYWISFVCLFVFVSLRALWRRLLFGLESESQISKTMFHPSCPLFDQSPAFLSCPLRSTACLAVM